MRIVSESAEAVKMIPVRCMLKSIFHFNIHQTESWNLQYNWFSAVIAWAVSSSSAYVRS